MNADQRTAMGNVTVRHVMDWYDGVVHAIVVVEGVEGYFLCSLLAYDPTSGRRVLALLPISEDQRVQFGDPECTWDVLRPRVRNAWSQADAREVMVCLTDNTDEVVSSRRVPIGDVQHQAASDINEAVDSSRRWWFVELERGGYG